MGFKYGKEARRARHDAEQSRRRTREQNERVIDLIQEFGGKYGWDMLWTYEDLPTEGGDLRFGCPQMRMEWLITREGEVTCVSAG